MRNIPQTKREELFKEKMLDLRRVTRVVAGGKRFRFRATLVLGDGRGQVGVGIAKGIDVAQSVAKAKAAAKRALFTVPLKDGRTVPHEVYAKYSAARVLVKPAAPGHGIRAGGAVRAVLTLAGIKDATSKCLGRTPNKLTNGLATIAALKKLKSRERVSHEHAN
jgi:small subunit ribosomal protein S5